MSTTEHATRMSIVEEGANPTSSLALTWRLHETREESARRGLTLRDIVDGAIAMADEEGLGEITMARLAARLGFSTMALYRHVPGKAELIELLFEAGIGVPDSETVVPGEWRASLESMARQMSSVYRWRPWLLDIPIAGPPASPNNLRWLETGLRALRDTPLTVQERAAVVAAVSSFVRGNERLLAEVTAGHKGKPQSLTYGALLRRVMPAGEFPETERAIATGIFDDDSGEDDVQFGIDRLLDGVQALIESRLGD